MRASIIIPAFEPHFEENVLLKQTLESVAAKTPGPYEVIVVDGGSSTETRRWLAGFKANNMPLNVVMLSENRGFTQHINIGLRIAEGANIVLMNSDIEVEEGWLEAMESVLADDSQVGLVGCQVRDMSDRNQIIHGGAVAPAAHKLGWVDKGDFQERTFDDDYLTFCCVMLRGEMVKQLGDLDEQFIIHASDSDYCYRAKEAGWKLCYEPKAIVYHEQEGTLRYMRGAQKIEAILERDQQRFRAKWKNHLLSLGRRYEFRWPEEEATSPNTSNSPAEAAAS